MASSGSGADLCGVALVEKDTSGDVLFAWCFPKVEPQFREVIVARAGLRGDAAPPAFVFSRFASTWVYTATAPVANPDQPKLALASITLLSHAFNPAKYKALLGLLQRAYEQGCSPLALMKGYLSVFTTGVFKSEHGVHEESKYDDRRAFVSPLKPLFDALGADALLVWVAMLLKKRVFVVADDVNELLPAVRSFPLLGAWHRTDWSLVFPYVTMAPAELEDLKGVYVAGFTDRQCLSQEDRYDLLVDLNARSVTVPEHARAAFNVATKFHRDLAKSFLQAAAAGNEAELIKLVATKTKELVANLQSLRTEHEDGLYVTLEELQAQNLPQNMDRFLYNVAQAEKLTRPS